MTVRIRTFGSLRSTSAAVAGLALLLVLSGCSGGGIFGRPRSYNDLAD